MKENFRMMVLKMRKAQKNFFKQPTRPAQEAAMSWERKVDKWLEQNAADIEKLEALTGGRSMPELPGVYNTVHDIETEEENN